MKKNKIIDDCPFCNGVISKRNIMIQNKKVALYSCSNMEIEYDDGDEKFLETEHSTCSFRIFSNCLLKYNKRSVSELEIRELLGKDKQTIVRLYSKKLYNEKTEKYGSEYFRYAIPDKEYGLSVLFDMIIDEDGNS